MKRGKFLVLDGNEGAGKTTLMTLAKEIFGDGLVLTREPGGTPFAESIRFQMLSTDGGKQADAKTQFNLAWAARADHMKNLIIPSLENGLNVLCDRFDSSTWAYQIYAQGGKELKKLFEIERRLIVGDYKPIYIILDLDPEIGLARKGKQVEKSLNNFDFQDMEFYQKVREGFLDFAKHYESNIVDATKSLEEVKAKFTLNLKWHFGASA